MTTGIMTAASLSPVALVSYWVAVCPEIHTLPEPSATPAAFSAFSAALRSWGIVSMASAEYGFIFSSTS
ncbi:hypothetical protein D3C76_1623610 [compost metagenome]